MKSRLTITRFIAAICALAASAQDKFSAKVRIYVQHNDSRIVENMTSYLARELRTLRDIDVTKDDNGFTIDVIMITIPNTRPTAYAVSVNTLKQSTRDGYAKATELLTNSVALIWSDKLKEFAENTTASFDTKVLDSERDLFKLRSLK